MNRVLEPYETQTAAPQNFMHDMTARLNGLVRLEDLVDNVEDFVAMIGLDGRFLYANRAWSKRLGYEESELTGLRFDDLIHPGDRSTTRKEGHLRKLVAGESVADVILRLVGKDGRVVPVKGSINLRIENGRPYYARVVFHDMTECQKVQQLKDEAVALASHELRTPLAVMIGALRAMAEMNQGDLSPQAVELAQMAHRNAERLLELTDRYLNVAKIESGGLDFALKPVELTPLIEEALSDMRGYAKSRGIRFELGRSVPGAVVNADPARLMEVLANLLSNAAKFSPADGVVSVAVEEAANGVSVAVVDRGPGISEQFRSRIFGKFARDTSAPDSATRKGTGLGLSIAKAIVEKMGGSIGFETELGKGTTFRFTLPVLAQTATA